MSDEAVFLRAIQAGSTDAAKEPKSPTNNCPKDCTMNYSMRCRYLCLFSPLVFLSFISALIAAEPAPPPRPVGQLKAPPNEQAEVYQDLFELVGKPGLLKLSMSKDTSLALQASWEDHKKLVKFENE